MERSGEKWREVETADLFLPLEHLDSHWTLTGHSAATSTVRVVLRRSGKACKKSHNEPGNSGRELSSWHLGQLLSGGVEA